MPPTEIATDGMLCLSRHENCPWDEALKSTEPSWTGLKYTCLKILHLYCKVFEREDVLDTIIRKTCKSCGCDRLKHSVYHEELSSVRDRLGLRDSPLQPHEELPGLNAKETEMFWQSLAERAPAGLGGTGPSSWRAWRNRALASQLPKQDLSLAHCRHVDDVHRKQYEDFVAARNEIALDIGVGRQVFGKSIDCIGCNKQIRSGNIAVEAPRLGEQAFYHPGCFSCSECEEPLVEFAYCALDGRLYCVRHYAERLKPRCHSCDELFQSCPRAEPPHPCSLRPFEPSTSPSVPFTNECWLATREMGIVLSVVISYAGLHEAVECIRHLFSGVIPYEHPGFDDLVEYYTKELQRSAKQANDWTTACGQGYLCLKENDDGKVSGAAVKYYHSQADSAAILFCTKISSFGDSVDEPPVANGNYRKERYSPAKTKTLVLNTSPERITVANRNKSPGTDTQSPAYSSEQRETDADENKDDKLTWQYTPINTTPEIHFQSYDDDKPGFFTEDYLRSLDGIKYRPLQRSDPSGRRRSFRKHRSSSSNSSKESRASRDEELQQFTSLEEAEFGAAQASLPQNEGFESAPNTWPHSFRSRSRERRTDGSAEGSVESVTDDAQQKETPGSLDEQVNDKELIFSGEYTKAMNKDWHSGHFCCWQCDESLTGQRYVLRDEHPYCIKCYESVFANGCEECNKTIGIDSKDLSYKDKHWHEACFLCAKCRVSLVDKQFGSKLDKIYCGNCYDAQFASRCDGCGEVFRAGTKKMEYKTRQWHEKCFCCVVCKNPIGTKSFIPREQEIYCAGCYEDKFATRCVKCNKIITQGGVTYKNEPWHRECFTCTNCDTSLAGQRFTSRDEKPYCADCFGELFAKRCTACTKPITGIGGTRFISFEDRHWHNDCFICAQCKTSLVGKGFITDAQDIICPECAKQKLM